MYRITESEQETLEFGRQLGEKVHPGGIYALIGDLGTGKTVFARGFAKGLSVEEPVTSPTFTIMQVYQQGRLPLYHFDVYRIGDPEEMYEIGFEDYLYGSGVCLVEWADLIPELMPKETVWIKISKNPEKGFDYRLIEIGSRDEIVKD